MPHIVVKDLSKTFWVAERAPGLWGSMRGLVHRKTRKVEALKGVSFSIEQGELVGYIGPNGAGKSTTIKILSGILVPSGGSATLPDERPGTIAFTMWDALVWSLGNAPNSGGICQC